MKRFMTAVESGVAANVANGGYMKAALQYGNHAGTAAHEQVVGAAT